MFEDDSDGAFLYETVLPMLSGVPLSVSVDNAAHEDVLADGIADDNTVTWWRAPLGGDSSLVHCTMQACLWVLKCMGMTSTEIRRIHLALVWSLCNVVESQLAGAPSISTGSRLAISYAMEFLSAEAAFISSIHKSPILPTECLRQMLELSENVHRLLGSKASSFRLLQQDGEEPVWFPATYCTDDRAFTVDFNGFPMFDGFRTDKNLEHLAGKAPEATRFRPIQFTLVPDEVKSFEEIGVALRHAEHVCTLLFNQRESVKNVAAQVLSLIQHVFTAVVPLPLPAGHSRIKQCMWQQNVRFDTQVDILRSVWLLSRHYCAACFSLTITSSFDGERVLTFACMTAVADAVVRMRASDVPSLMCLNIAGSAPPTDEFEIKPFGVDAAAFIQLSEEMRFSTPELVTARTRVLDYFVAQRKLIDDSHILFQFEYSPSPGAMVTLMRQICWEVGFPSRKLAMYATGELPEVVDSYPEFRYFRDVAFLFKYMMCPTSDALPDIRAWAPKDAELQWSWHKNDSDGYVTVRAFKKELKPVLIVREELEERAAAASGLKGFFHRGKKLLDRATHAILVNHRDWQSGANPSVLTGQPVDNEEDILHIQKLPDFGGKLSQRSSELLLSYLTVPYLRIPLVLSFFARPENVGALAGSGVQDVVDAVLFEPGAWQPDEAPVIPKEVPSKDRSYLATPLGLLFNELQKSPQGIVKSLSQLLERVIELDTGRFTRSSRVILYVIRLLVRVEGFMRFISLHHAWDKSSINGTGWSSFVRGFTSSDELAKLINECRMVVRTALDDRVFPMLERWAEDLTKVDKLQDACVVHAHLALLYLHTPEVDLNLQSVITLISSQIFLSARYPFHLEVGKGKRMRRKMVNIGTEAEMFDLGIAPMELFDLFQKKRGGIVRWLAKDSQQRSLALEAVTRIVTLTGRRIKAKDSALVDRNWRSLNGMHCGGRFVPSVKSQTNLEVAEIERRRMYERPEVADETEINVQLGTFSLKSARLQGVDPDACKMLDFMEVFGDAGKLMQCAAVKITTRRYWVRLVGRRHDVMLWTPDSRVPPVHFSRSLSSCHGSECWIVDVTKECGLSTLFPDIVWCLRDARHHDDEPYAVLVGLVHGEALGSDKSGDSVAAVNALKSAIKRQDVHSLRSALKLAKAHNLSETSEAKEAETMLTSLVGDNDEEDSEDDEEGSGGSVGGGADDFAVPASSVKEVVVFRRQRVVHVFSVVEHGRQFYRRLDYASNHRTSLREMCLMSEDHEYFKACDSYPCADGAESIQTEPVRATSICDGWVQVESKRGDWDGFYAVLQHDSLLLLSGVDQRQAVRRFPMLGAAVRRPKTARKGKHCFRLNATGEEKWIVAVDSMEELEKWEKSIAEVLTTLQASVDSVSLPCVSFVQPSKSLVISRNLGREEHEKQVRIPIRFLRGLLPDALLNSYEFWQNEDSSLVGYLTREAEARASSEGHTALRISLVNHDIRGGSLDRPCATAIVKRVPVEKVPDGVSGMDRVQAKWSAERAVGAHPVGELTLLEYLGAEGNSLLAGFGDALLRIENASHILVWTSATIVSGREQCTIDKIEFPRLHLSFVSRRAHDGTIRLFSVEHSGYFVIFSHELKSTRVKALVRGVVHGMILMNESGDLAILCPATLPSRKLGTDCDSFSAEPIFIGGRTSSHHLYPVHISQTFLFTPTLSSALYLLVLRFSLRQYDVAFRLCDSCVSDTALSAEDAACVNHLRSFTDTHPDAVAVRLKLSLLWADTAIVAPWDLRVQLVLYSARLPAVSGACRLAAGDELKLLEAAGASKERLMHNRISFLEGAFKGDGSCDCILPAQTLPTQPEFEGMIDKSCLRMGAEVVGKLSKVSYKRPLECKGMSALDAVSNWEKNGLRLKGGKDNLGFLFFYEVMCGSLRFQVLDTDDPFFFGSCLLRLLPRKDWVDGGLLISLLRVLDKNRRLIEADDCPKVRMGKGLTEKLGTMFAGMDNAFSRLIKEVLPYVSKHSASLEWQVKSNEARRKKVGSVRICKDLWKLEALGVPHNSDLSCSSRKYSRLAPLQLREHTLQAGSLEIKAFSSLLLDPIGLADYVSEQSRSDRGLEPVSEVLPFDVSKHRFARSHVAKELQSRLAADIKAYAEGENTGRISRLSCLLDKDIDECIRGGAVGALAAATSKLGTLISALQELELFEEGYMVAAIDAVLLLANECADTGSVDAHRDMLCHRLSVFAKMCSNLDFEFITLSLLSTVGDKDILHVNPFMVSADVVLQRTADALLHVNRLGHIRRCLGACKSLSRVLEKVKGGGGGWNSAYGSLDRVIYCCCSVDF